MKYSNYEKRKKNGIITSVITSFIILLIAVLFVMLAISPIKSIIKIPLLILASFLAVIVLPGLIFKFMFVIYNYLNKSIDVVESTLSSEFKVIYLKNTTCLKKSAVPLHLQRRYMAKLNDDCSIVIRIENVNDNSIIYEQTTKDYLWFFRFFTFEKN